MKKFVAALLVLVVVLAGLGLAFLVQVPFYLVAGWFFFLRDTLPNVTVDWSSVGLAAVAFILLASGVHLCGRRLVNSRDSGVESASAQESWQSRWTIALDVDPLQGIGQALFIM